MYIALFILLLTSSHEIIETGNEKIFKYGQTLQKDKQKFQNSTIIFAGTPEKHMYLLAPFLIYKKNIKLYNNNEPYSYVMNYFSLSDKDVEKISKETEQDVYLVRIPNDKYEYDGVKMLTVNFEKYPLFEDYEFLQIYKAK